ncbi:MULTISPECIES: hypothetical protein [Crateriforma]|uniref:Hemerythrin-like domain-containing protein n=1 Tax=Crateriforma conspicua TaxID=2527996 RepID=A0A5C5Y4L8_9PLAN|nr:MULTISPECIES: hypothetical protein [Crateriforma]QDV64270.1 hypothetical protein Mal65_34220 [Crateriforma conspicua]TWT69663.1 hypothetical protein Pan14r_19530 [Crateriforma conspicua]TWU66354.1 hypothetical protein V7x_19190 [Crateriforma conspicua]
MATMTEKRTLVVNPAFLQEIKDSNPDLWQTIHQLRQTCETEDGSAATVRSLTRLLDTLRDQLSMQFALEEAYGFVEIPVGSSVRMLTDPEHFQKTSLAHDQHCQLYLRLSELAEQAEELQYRGVGIEGFRGLIAAVEAFDARLRQHEQLEADLIASAGN